MPLTISNNLDSVPAVPGQATPENTVNDKLGEHDSFLTVVKAVSVSGGNATVSLADYRRYRSYRVTGNTVGGRSLTLQAVSRAVEIDNSDAGNTQSLAIKLGSTTINLAVGKKGFYETDGTANGLELIVSNDASGSGGLLAANNLSDVASKIAAIDTISVKGADIASAATINLDTATGNYVHVTGTTTITAITLSSGRQRTVYFTGALTLTNGASLVLPGSANITTAAGDVAVFVADGTTVQCTDYCPASKASARVLIGAVIGTDVQAFDAQLSSLVRQNSQSAAYTTVLTDGGKHLLHPAADTTARTFTIDSNANVAYPIGTAITFVNQHGAGVVTIAITSDTMRLAGTGAIGSRTLAADGIATALKITSTEWIISGTGLT